MPATVLRLHPRTPLVRGTAPWPIEDDLLGDFFATYKPSTIRTYRKALRGIATYAGVRLEELSHSLLRAGPGAATQLVRRYKAHLMASGNAPASINVALAAVRSLLRVARSTGRINWTIDVADVPARSYRDTRGPGTPAVRRMLETAAAHPDPATAARDRSVLRTLYDLALRASELVSLDVEGVERDDDGRPVAVHILGKGRHERERLTLPDATSAELARWLKHRGELPGALITGRSGARLSLRGVEKLIARLGRRAGLAHRVWPHGIRHSAITASLDAGSNIREVKRYSRHAKLETLLRYDDNRQDLGGRVAGVVADLL